MKGNTCINTVHQKLITHTGFNKSKSIYDSSSILCYLFNRLRCACPDDSGHSNVSISLKNILNEINCM